MDQQKIAQRAAPLILEKIGQQKGIDLSTAVPAVVDGIVKYHFSDQATIIETVKAVCPVFEKVAGEFFSFLNAVTQISMEEHTKETELIVNLIFEQDGDLDQKMKHVTQYMEQRKIEKREKLQPIVRITKIAAAGLAAVAGGRAVGKVIDSGVLNEVAKQNGKSTRVKTKEQNKTKRTKIRAKAFQKSRKKGRK